MSTAARGEVYDLGYQHYTGPREGRARARRAVYKDGIRTALGIGRGGRAKILPWLFIVGVSIPALVLALVAGTVDRLAPGAEFDLPSHGLYYDIVAIIIYLFAAVVGPELLSPDRRNGVINLYLVRPLSGTDYVIARWAAILTVMVVVAWIPQFVLLVGLTLGDSDPAGYLADNWLDVPRFLGAGFALALFAATLALEVASFTTRRAYAAAFMIGLIVIGSGLAGGLSEALDDDASKWVALINISFAPIYLNDLIFDRQSDGPGELARALPAYVRVLWYSLWTFGSGIVLWRRYRDLSL